MQRYVPKSVPRMQMAAYRAKRPDPCRRYYLKTTVIRRESSCPLVLLTESLVFWRFARLEESDGASLRIIKDENYGQARLRAIQ